MTSGSIETALRLLPEVDDCKVVTRRTTAGASELIVYAVPLNAAMAADVEAAVSACMAEIAPDLPASVLILPMAPLRESGEAADWDLACLDKLALLDAATLTRAETLVREACGSQTVAAVLETSLSSVPPRHLSDLLPDWSRPSMASAADARRNDSNEAASTAAPAISDGGELLLCADAPTLLIDLLLAAVDAPLPAGLVVVRDDAQEAELSYADLLLAARRTLTGLRAAGLAAGDPLILQLRRHDDFLIAFWACQLGGMVPVPVGVPVSFADANGPLRRLADAIDMFDSPFVAADAAVIAGLGEAQGVMAIARHRVLDIAALVSNPPDLSPHPGRPTDTALMMLTSGSTGRPKGVPQPHRNLLARTFGSQQMHAWRRGMVTLNWMPLDHVAGLIYFHLRDVYLAARQIHVAAEAILRAPLLWLDLLERHRVQVSFAPNFAFGLVCGQADVLARQRRDLSALERLLNGGEAIVAAPTRRFMQLLSSSGLRPDVMMPAWGMSEVSSGVTYEDNFRLDTTADSDSYVKVGRPVPGVRLRIVDEEGRLLREGQVGQLQVAGATVFDGYFGAAPARDETFTADGWFRTGDVARLDDGHLTITGRDKDVIIINGANYAGPAIEAAVEELPGVARSFTAAVAIADARTQGGEGLALFIVPEQAGNHETADLLRAVRQKVVQTFGISPAVIVPLARDDVPKTSIGKIQRGALRKTLLQGGFESLLRRVDCLSANEHTLPPWFHRRLWCHQAAPAAAPATAMLVFAQAADALAQALLDLAPGSSLVELGDAYERIDHRHFRIDGRALRPATAQLLALLQAETGRAPERAVWLCETQAAAQRGTADRCVAATQSFIDLVAGLSAHGGSMTLLAVTRGGVRVRPGEPQRAEAAVLATLVQTASQELPHCRAVHVDVGPDALEDTAAALAPRIAAEFATKGEQREIAWRGDRRWVAMLQPLKLDGAAPSASPLRQGGRYVLTGGLGGIGLELAAWLLERFGAKVLVLSRLPPDEPTAARLQGLSSAITQACADVRDIPALGQALQRAADGWGAPPDAIFHLAGHYHEAVLVDEDAVGLHAAFDAKVGGMEALLATRHVDTSIVAFSSVAGVLGGALVGAYGAANRALDAAIIHPKVWSLAWSTWQDTGLTRRFGAREPLRAMGVAELPLPQAFASLRVALMQPPGQIVIGLMPDAPFVARRSLGVALEQSVTAFCESRDPLPLAPPMVLSDRFGVPFALRLRRLESLPRKRSGAIDRAALQRIARQGAGYRSASGDTEIRLLRLWQRVLGVQPISSDASFFELGGQSLLASQLITSIGVEFGARWSLRDVFEAPTIAAQALRLAASLAAYLAASLTIEPAEAAPHADRHQTLPLSSAQQRLWFLDQVHPHNSAFNIPATIRFAERPDPQRVRRAIQALVDRHESLRTRFAVERGEPAQIISAQLEIPMSVERLAQSDSASELAAAEARQPFDLAAGPLLRARLLELPDGGSTLLLTLHHIIGDGWSMKVLFQDWLAAYEADAALTPLPLQYADFAAWQRSYGASPAFAVQFDHWRARLAGNTEGFTLPTDRPRPLMQTYRGATVASRIPPDLTRRVRALARSEGVTLFVTLLSAYKALLARCAQLSDVVVGSVVANRDRVEFEALIGFIVNLVVLRTDLGADPRFVDILQRVHRGVLDAYANHEMPFETLVELLQPQRDTSRSPLFQIAFDLRDTEITRSRTPGLAFGVMEPDLGAAQYDLHLTLEESHDAEPALTALWQYNTDLFDRATIERMAANFQTLLASAVEQPGRRLSQLALVSPAEQLSMAAWNRREAPFPREQCLHQLFEAHAARAPMSTAVVHGPRTISYAELERRSNAWAHRLQALGVGRDSIVGICLDRSIDLVVALLAILKAGGAFLPLDPTYPQDRLDHMVSDSGIRRLLTSSRIAPRFAEAQSAGLALLVMDAEDSASELGSVERSMGAPPCPASADSLAYVIYTSGSTGKPKCVLVEHRGWCNVAQAQQDLFALRPGMRVLQFASASFDACAFEVAMALASGSTLVLADSVALMPGQALASLLREQRVEVVTLPPTALAALPPGDYPDLKVITVAGEACPKSLVERFAHEPLRFFNLYGPTEATIWSSVAECHWDDADAPTIGVPVPNVQLHVLDVNRKLLPIGMPGELYIGGVGIARGYHRRPEANAERFLPDPFAGVRGARMYRSGDVVRLNGAGQLEFLGRSDHQVKLRGFRIELGEIEAVLRGCPGVGEVLTLLRRMADGDQALVAYLTPAGAQPVDLDNARALLHAALPQHMIPAWIVPIPAFPLTPNGKIDRARLPDPAQRAAAEAAKAAELPLNALELSIATVWSEVLGNGPVDRRQNFFDAGGHSIKMAQVHARLTERLARSIPLVDLFQYPTVAALAAHLAATAAAVPAAMAVQPPALKPSTPQVQRLSVLAQRQRAARSGP
ncbi:N/A [soil metagenome]